jgi:sulfate adenylyltransferase subunit 2
MSNINRLLNELESKSIFIIREMAVQFKKLAILWSVGKDSTTLLWIIKKAFFGKIPYPVIHLDTGFKFPHMYRFRDKITKKWKINLIVVKNETAVKRGVHPDRVGRFVCCTTLKTEALKQTIQKYSFDALLLGIRRDEHSIRAKERYFSPRNKEFKWRYKSQPPEFWDLYKAIAQEEIHHYRIHPLLHWTEIDIWRYIKREKIPVNSLYFSKRNKRFRSLGCMPCTTPITSKASNINEIIKELEKNSTSERVGRAQDKEKEYMMQSLRSLGYM